MRLLDPLTRTDMTHLAAAQIGSSRRRLLGSLNSGRKIH